MTLLHSRSQIQNICSTFENNCKENNLDSNFHPPPVEIFFVLFMGWIEHCFAILIISVMAASIFGHAGIGTIKTEGMFPRRVFREHPLQCAKPLYI